jgi:hypothetical protein
MACRKAGEAAGQGGDTLTAKEYLSQLGELTTKIKQKKQEFNDIQDNLGIVIKSDGTESVKVQTSFVGANGKQTETQAIRIVTIENDIKDKIIEYIETKNKIIDQIHNLNNELYIDILYRRYVRGERDFTKMAYEMGYTYKYIVNKHGEALAKFKRIHQLDFKRAC